MFEEQAYAFHRLKVPKRGDMPTDTSQPSSLGLVQSRRGPDFLLLLPFPRALETCG